MSRGQPRGFIPARRRGLVEPRARVPHEQGADSRDLSQQRFLRLESARRLDRIPEVVRQASGSALPGRSGPPRGDPTRAGPFRSRAPPLRGTCGTKCSPGADGEARLAHAGRDGARLRFAARPGSGAHPNGAALRRLDPRFHRCGDSTSGLDRHDARLGDADPRRNRPTRTTRPPRWKGPRRGRHRARHPGCRGSRNGRLPVLRFSRCRPGQRRSRPETAGQRGQTVHLCGRLRWDHSPLHDPRRCSDILRGPDGSLRTAQLRGRIRGARFGAARARELVECSDPRPTGSNGPREGGEGIRGGRIGAGRGSHPPGARADVGRGRGHAARPRRRLCGPRARRGVEGAARGLSSPRS